MKRHPRRRYPKGDRLLLVDRILPLLVENPRLSVDDVQAIIGVRRGEAARCVAAARRAIGADPALARRRDAA